MIRIDGDYDNQVANPYTANAGAGTTAIGVIAWSLGADASWWFKRRQEHWYGGRRRDFVAVISARFAAVASAVLSGISYATSRCAEDSARYSNSQNSRAICFGCNRQSEI